MNHILIIDDDPGVCKLMSTAITRMGYPVSSVCLLSDGLDTIERNHVDVVFLDVNLPDGNGLEALPRIRENASSPEVVIITGEGDPDGAELAIKSGAWDYLEKPFLSLKDLSLTINRVLQYREEKLTRLRRKALERENIIGTSPIISNCLDLAHKAANSNAGVLVTGETGTGKELFARIIHRNSGRRERSFVVVDCASLPETLVESTLFGHVKGAFTGAISDRKGLVEQADRGTLFLDEVGELPIPVQKTFLRVLQEHRFLPVGGTREHDSDFRLIAATHRNLEEMTANGQFRKDLLYRMKSIQIDLPPLRERSKDTLEVALQTMARLCERYGIGIKGFSPEFIDALSSYTWPGNVRELVNCIESALSEAGNEPVLIPRHLPMQVRVQLARDALSHRPKTEMAKNNAKPESEMASFRDFVATAVIDAEKRYLNELLSRTSRDIKASCRIANLSRARLYTLLKKHSLGGSREIPILD
jgi:two-component system, NtrC family, response regulator